MPVQEKGSCCARDRGVVVRARDRGVVVQEDKGVDRKGAMQETGELWCKRQESCRARDRVVVDKGVVVQETGAL
jgi:hypothetical protein